jgi:DNA-binding GntR family transcriptional regulator
MTHLSERTLSKLQAAISNAEDTLDGGSNADYMKADFDFHQIIYEDCGNPWIPVIISNLHVFLHIGRNLSMGEDFRSAARASIRDHKEMLALMRQGDTEGLEEAFDRHMGVHLDNIKHEHLKFQPT